MADCVDATLLLADFAQVSGGKLYITGGGWNFIGPKVGPTALGALIQVPWDEANQKHRWKLELVDDDGKLVLRPDQKPISVEGEFEVGRPAGHPLGTPLNVPLAVNFGPLPLTPGRRFVWILHIDDQTEVHWRVAFNVRETG
jgi:hypothetical protein